MENYGNQNFYDQGNPQKPKSKIWLWGLISILIIIFGIIAFYFISSSSKIDTCIESWSCTDWSSCINEQQTRICADSNSCGTNENKPNEQQNCTLQIIDCGSNTQTQETIGDQVNFDCLIKSSKNCEPAKLLNTLTTNLFGVLYTTTTYIELKGMEGKKCRYYQRTENISIELSEELKQQMLERGGTQEEINQQEQIMNEEAQKTIGLEQKCKFNSTNLNSMLKRWKEGTYEGGASCTLNPNGTIDCTYTGDFENAECISY